MRKRLLLLLWPALLLADVEDKETIRQSFPAAQTLEVDNINGFVHVTAGVSGSIELIANKTFRGDTASDLDQAKREIKLDTSATSEKVRLYVDGPFRERNGWRHRDYHFNYDFELRVPPGTNLMIRTINGGDIQVSGIHGDLNLRHVNGKIDVKDARKGGSVTTVNGGITLDFRQAPSNGLEVKTVNGQVSAAFPKNLNANLRFKTFNGDVFTDFPVAALAGEPGQAEKRNGKYVYKSNRFFGAKAGSGGPEYKFETLNGTIRIIEGTN